MMTGKREYTVGELVLKSQYTNGVKVLLFLTKIIQVCVIRNFPKFITKGPKRFL